MNFGNFLNHLFIDGFGLGMTFGFAFRSALLLLPERITNASETGQLQVHWWTRGLAMLGHRHRIRCGKSDPK